MIKFKLFLLGSVSFSAAVAAAQQQYRDPRSFAFDEAVTDVQEVVVTSRSTVMYTDHPRGSNGPSAPSTRRAHPAAHSPSSWSSTRT